MRILSSRRRLALALLLAAFALAAAIHPDLVFFGIAPPDPQTF
ncbi:MAG TPA: hypothetical protein VFP12_07690 [Allosphingosinicella sp.]|nr:hypothetical protein [Allosphingosinicella sp.]